MPEQIFENQIALITGSGRGIGKAIALHLANLGADVVINYFRNRKPAEETAAAVEALGRKALVVKANMGEVEDIETLFLEIEKEFGGLDILVSNAASGYNKPAMEQKPKSWDWVMNINARAFLIAAQKAVPLMEKRGGGSIVAITSAGAERVIKDYVMVGTSKAALNSLTRYLAIEFAPKNIRVNAISPGVVATDVMQHFEAFREEGFLERIAKNTPSGRLVTPEDVAKTTAFLCSSDAEMILGQVINVDGGYLLPLVMPELPAE